MVMLSANPRTVYFSFPQKLVELRVTIIAIVEDVHKQLPLQRPDRGDWFSDAWVGSSVRKPQGGPRR